MTFKRQNPRSSRGGSTGAQAPKAGSGPRALEDTLDLIHKQYGKGAIMRLGEGNIVQVSGISTGCLSLDAALGGQGIPRDRVTEIFGPESSGKTTLTLHCIASAQKNGGVAAFIDAEHALDPSYAKRLGVNLDQLLVSQPDTGEQALEIAEMLIRSNSVDLVVVDSVAALVPKAEIEGEMGDSHVGLQARLMSQAMRKLTAAIARSHCSLVFINQIREKIGVMFGSPETTTGGRALKFYSSVRIDIRRIGALKTGDETIGMRARATVVKNKVAPPFRKTEFDILFAEGISALGDLIDLGVENRIIEKSGAWFSYGATRLGQGRERVRDFLKENPDILAEVEDKVREAIGMPPATRPQSTPGEAADTKAPDTKATEPSTRPANGQKPDATRKAAASGAGQSPGRRS